MTPLFKQVLILLFLAGPIMASHAQVRHIPFPGWRVKPVKDIVIRGIHYKDHSANTSLDRTQVILGDYFNINSRSLFFNPANQYVVTKVVLQEANRAPNSAGVTVYELKRHFAYGGRLQIEAPWAHLFKNRTFHVSVFIYTGTHNLYAHAGKITFQ